jgi:hypothetical protein
LLNTWEQEKQKSRVGVALFTAAPVDCFFNRPASVLPRSDDFITVTPAFACVEQPSHVCEVLNHANVELDGRANRDDRIVRGSQSRKLASASSPNPEVRIEPGRDPFSRSNPGYVSPEPEVRALEKSLPIHVKKNGDGSAGISGNGRAGFSANGDVAISENGRDGFHAGNLRVFQNAPFDAHFGKSVHVAADGGRTTAFGNGRYDVHFGNKEYSGNGRYEFTFTEPKDSARTFAETN